MKSRRGFWRMFEAILAMILIFAIVNTLVQQAVPIPASSYNIIRMQKYAEDIRDMVCNSDVDRRTVLEGGPYFTMNESVKFALPPNIEFRIIMQGQGSSGIVGYEPPDLTSAKREVATASCSLSGEFDETETTQVTVMVWA